MFVIGLSEAVKGSVLREACAQLAPVHSIRFHHHPKTRTFLGAATISFTHTGHGRKAASKLDGTIVGGCYLRAEVDDKGVCVCVHMNINTHTHTHNYTLILYIHCSHNITTCVYGDSVFVCGVL